jgi:hypothetical protein
MSPPRTDVPSISEAGRADQGEVHLPTAAQLYLEAEYYDESGTTHRAVVVSIQCPDGQYDMDAVL